MLVFLNNTTTCLDDLSVTLESVSDLVSFGVAESEITDNVKRLRELANSIPELMAMASADRQSELPDLGLATEKLRVAVARLSVVVNGLPAEVKQSDFFRDFAAEISSIGRSLSSIQQGVSMTRTELKKKLESSGVDADKYCLQGGLPNEQYCIENTDDGIWRTYYSERGERTGVSVFNNESDACHFFFEWLAQFRHNQN